MVLIYYLLYLVLFSSFFLLSNIAEKTFGIIEVE